MSKRVCILWVPEEVMLTLLGGWRQQSHLSLPYLEECADAQGRRFALPKDVQIQRSMHSPMRRAIGLLLSHPSFPEVSCGEQPPTLTYSQAVVEICPALGNDKYQLPSSSSGSGAAPDCSSHLGDSAKAFLKMTVEEVERAIDKFVLGGNVHWSNCYLSPEDWEKLFRPPGIVDPAQVSGKIVAASAIAPGKGAAGSRDMDAEPFTRVNNGRVTARLAPESAATSNTAPPTAPAAGPPCWDAPSDVRGLPLVIVDGINMGYGSAPLTSSSALPSNKPLSPEPRCHCTSAWNHAPDCAWKRWKDSNPTEEHP